MKYMNPMVSVIIPTRHRPELVTRAVRSALGQTYGNLEVIVVVDGPDSQTTAVLDAMQAPRLLIVELSENVGACEARNIGAAKANGEWVALLDDDDEWLPDKLVRQMQMVSLSGHNSALVACYYYHRKHDRNDEIKPRRVPAATEDLRGYIFETRCQLNTSTYLCTRELFLSVPFEKDLPCLQDVDWYLRIVNRGDVPLIVVPEPLSIYYDSYRRDSISSRRDWRFIVDYGKNHRFLMTKRAYTRFLLKYCLRSVVRQKAGLAEIFRLFIEMCRNGTPTPDSVSLFFAYWLLR